MDDQIINIRQKKELKRKWRIISTLFVLVVLISLLAVFLSNRFFVINDVVIQQSTYYSEEQIFTASQLKLGTPLLKLKKSESEYAIEKNLPFIINASVSRALPNKVYIGFDEDPGSMYITLGGKIFALSDNQRVIARLTDSSYPSYRIELVCKKVSRCIVGEQIVYSDETLFEMISEIYSAIKANDVNNKIKCIDISDKFNIILNYDDRFSVKFGNSESALYKIAMVKKVVEQLYDDDEGEIDITEVNTAYVRLYNKK